MYETFYKLREKPFTLLPDPDFLYWSENHSRAYAMLEYGMLTHSPITLVTADTGEDVTEGIKAYEYLAESEEVDFIISGSIDDVSKIAQS